MESKLTRPQAITSHFCILLEMMQSDKSQNLNKSQSSKIKPNQPYNLTKPEPQLTKLYTTGNKTTISTLQ
jgi:hypothetical protein